MPKIYLNVGLFFMHPVNRHQISVKSNGWQQSIGLSVQRFFPFLYVADDITDMDREKSNSPGFGDLEFIVTTDDLCYFGHVIAKYRKESPCPVFMNSILKPIFPPPML